MGPEAGTTVPVGGAGSVRRLAVMRTARKVQKTTMSAISRARSPRIGPAPVLSPRSVTMSLVSRLP